MNPFRSRLFLGVLATMLALSSGSVGVSGCVSLREHRRVSLEAMERSLEPLARSVANAPTDEPLPLVAGLRLTRFAPDGSLLIDSHPPAALAGARADWPEVDEAARTGRGRSVRSTPSDPAAATLLVAVRGSNGIGRASRSLADLAAGEEALRDELLLALVLAAAASFVAAFVVHRLVAGEVRPILAATAVLPAAGDAPKDPEDPLRALARAVAGVIERAKRAEARAESEMAELRAILDHAAEGVIVLGEDGRIELVNGAARRIFGAPADAAGRPFVEVSRSAYVQGFLDELRRTAGTHQIDVEIGGEPPRTVRLTGGRIPGAAGSAGPILLMAADISDLRRLERQRIDFVANASHELKTPLSAILGYTETLLDDSDLDDETRRKFLQTILRNSMRLQELVSDMLRLARLESPAAHFRFEPLDLAELLRRVVEAHTPAAKERDVTLSYGDDAGTPVVTGDRELLTQCVSNLVSNALRFTPAGGAVSVSLAVDDGEVRVDVSDTGVGIPPEHLPRIFERFYRADPARAREVGGTGLGLAIAKHAAAAHGGRIEVTSAVAKGSRFRVVLPEAPR